MTPLGFDTLVAMIVAIQGEKGSFHDLATQQYFAGSNFSLLPKPSFRSVFHSLSDNEADIAVVAVENSLYGSIHETYDLLISHDFLISGEMQLKINQNLIARPGASLKDIEQVISHPAALDQCRKFLQNTLPNAQIIEHNDTAGAVAEIASQGSKNQAAIASRHSANLHGMRVLCPDIEDEPGNITRFIVLGQRSASHDSANKASLVLSTNHQPGALYRALKVFNDNDANLTKLESRQIRGEPYRYKFIVDCMATQEQLVSIVHGLEQQDCKIKLLGHYRASVTAPQ